MAVSYISLYIYMPVQACITDLQHMHGTRSNSTRERTDTNTKQSSQSTSSCIVFYWLTSINPFAPNVAYKQHYADHSFRRPVLSYRI